MSDLCDRCGICCKLIPVDLDKNILLRNGIEPLDEELSECLIPIDIEAAKEVSENYVENVLNYFPDATFCRCKFLAPSNLCSKLNIPESCQKYPSHPFAFLHDDCGYLGEIFVKNEEIKQKIRRYKEEIIDYETLIAQGTKEEKGYKKIIISLQRFIDKYKIYGSEDW